MVKQAALSPEFFERKPDDTINVSEHIQLLDKADPVLTANIFFYWRDHTPDIRELALACCDYAGFSERETKIVTEAAELAAQPHDNAYHNNDHFREVFALCFQLKKDPILWAAALAHDYGHDGKTNTVEGRHIPFRLEGTSVDALMPVIQQAGATKEEMLKAAFYIFATDVSAPQNGTSPADSLKNVIDNLEANNKLFLPLLNERLEGIIKENGYNETQARTLINEALILHDADIAISAALSPEMNTSQSLQLAQEWGMPEGETPNQAFFLGTLCRGKLYSQEGRKHLQGAMNSIMRSHDMDIPNEQGTPTPR